MDWNSAPVNASLTKAQFASAVSAAEIHVTRERLVELCTQLIETPSSTGNEGPLAALIAGVLRDCSGHGEIQRLDDRQANAWGRIAFRRPATGRVVMLYSPIDTVTSGRSTDDLPWAAEPSGSHFAGHQVNSAEVNGDVITGLGAMNPKGHATCVLMAFEAIARAGVEFPGEVIAAFGAGGMPTFALADPSDPMRRQHTGHGVGCSFLVERGVWADAAVIAKSGWTVSTEEVGLAWCDVVVRGTHTYVGARHRLPYRNAIADAATIVGHLEHWFPNRAERHRSGTLLPQGVVASINAGSDRTAAFTPAEARLRVDLRIGHDQSPLDAKRELEDELATLRAAHDGLDAEVELVAGIPSSSTSLSHWLSTAAIDSWEAVAGRRHQPPTEQSGATDANILRQRNIPTVRVGLPKAASIDGSELAFSAGMNTVSVASMVDLTRVLIRLALATAGQNRDAMCGE